jgi:DNA-binding NarL/FixJ family response regulator
MRALVLQSSRLYGQVIGEIMRGICAPIEPIICDRACEALRTMRGGSVAVAIVGVDIPDLDGMDFVPEIINSKLSLHTIILTERTDKRTLSALRRLAYDGFVDATTAGIEDLRSALRCVMDGQRYTSANIAARISEPGFSRQPCLSQHEEAILSLLGEGLDDKDAARHLRLAPRTVECHRCRIMRKLSLHHKGELIDYALANLYVRRSCYGILHPGFEHILRQMQGDGNPVAKYDEVLSETSADSPLALTVTRLDWGRLAHKECHIR